MNFVVPVDHRAKLRKAEKKKKKDNTLRQRTEKTMEHENDSNTNYNWCALDVVSKGLVQGLKDLEIRGQVETIQTTASLRSARKLRRVLETRED